LGRLAEYIRRIFRNTGNTLSGQDEFIPGNEYLQSELSNTGNIMYSIDKEFNIKWLNKQTSEQYPNAIGKKCHEVFAKNHLPCPDCSCTKALATGQVQKSVRHLNYAPTIKGRGYWESILIPLFDSSKHVTGALTISQEIEDIEKLREELINKNMPKLADNELDIFIKQNFRKVFDSLYIPICITGNNLKVVFSNNSFSEILSKSDENLTDRYITDLMPEITEISTQRILSLIVSGVDEQSYNFILKRDFDEKKVRLQVSPLKLSDSKIAGIIWKLSQISTESLTLTNPDSGSRFDENFGIMIIDDEGKVIQWNNFLTNLFDWSEQELIGMPNPIITQEILSQYVADKNSEKLEISLNNKSGNVIDLKVSIFPVFNSIGEASQFVCMVENSTFEKYIKSEFKDLEERYNNFIKNFDGITFKFDLDFNPTHLSRYVRSLTGYTVEDFLSNKLRFKEIVYPDDILLINDYIYRISNRIKTDRELELRLIAKDNSTKWIHMYFQNTTDEFGNVTQIQGFLYNVTHRKEVEEELKHSREQFRTLAMYLETAREEEKKRLALEIHDEVGHALTALKLELAWVLKKKFLRQDVMFEKVRKMNELIESTIRKVRSISSELRPSVLDHFGLEAALEWQASEFQKRSAVRCKLQLDKQDISIDEKSSTAIFRIFQEILNNIAKHAKATRVDVVLEKEDSYIVLKVRDNGKGFKLESTKNTQSLGLLGMTERANAIGGDLSISSVIGVGTTVMLNVPLRKK